MIDLINIVSTAIIFFILGLATTYLWGFDLPKIITTTTYFIITIIFVFGVQSADLVEGFYMFADFLLYVIIPMALGEAVGDACGVLFRSITGYEN